MAPILPVLKFAEVALKQIAKPVSKQLLEGALAYPQVTKFCIRIGQMLHYVNVRVTRSAEGQTSSRKIFELPEDKAKDAGALFLGEVLVFSLTGAIVGWQWYMSTKSAQEDAESEERYAQLKAAEKHAEFLARDLRLEELEMNVHRMWKVLERFDAPSVFLPPSLSSPPGKSAAEQALDKLMGTSMSTSLV